MKWRFICDHPPNLLFHINKIEVFPLTAFLAYRTKLHHAPLPLSLALVFLIFRSVRLLDFEFLQILLTQHSTIDPKYIVFLISWRPMSDTSTALAAVKLNVLVAPYIEVCLASDFDFLCLIVSPKNPVASTNGA